MKRDTLQYHARIVNDALYYMYAYIDTPITLETLSTEHQMSPYHFHRIFKEQTGENFFETLQSIRLQKAANLLLVNPNTKVSQIAQQCGYGSHSAFIRAFAKRYGVTPTHWRNGYYLEFSLHNINTSHYARAITSKFDALEPRIVRQSALHVAYMRHRGYGRSIRQTWQRLYAYALEYDLDDARQIGLHHDNPSITPLEACAYVAAIEVSSDFKPSGSVSTFSIPASLCVVFHVEGCYGEILNLIRHIYHVWLPKSGFEAKTLPPYVIYKKNHFLSKDERFDLEFYLPVSVL